MIRGKKEREQVLTYLAALGLRHLSPEHHAAGRVLNSHKRRRETCSHSVAGQREVARMRSSGGCWRGTGRAPPLSPFTYTRPMPPAVREILTLPKVHQVEKKNASRPAQSARCRCKCSGSTVPKFAAVRRRAFLGSIAPQLLRVQVVAEVGQREGTKGREGGKEAHALSGGPRRAAGFSKDCGVKKRRIVMTSPLQSHSD